VSLRGRSETTDEAIPAGKIASSQKTLLAMTPFKNKEEFMEEKKEQELAEIRTKLKELLVSGLSLDDVNPAQIKDDEILFGEGLGLDSLDAVEIVVLLQRNFGLEVKDMKEGKQIFYSIDTLSRYIQENRKK
jgi:acyl carrier protein